MTVVPLRHVAEVRTSSVDKHSHDGELPVQLCNYVDVYKNDKVCPGSHLMRATATPDEVSRFHLEPGDSVLTKDSEDPSDIGISAYVESTASDFVCGYHLAIARPLAGCHPRYLSWALRTRPVLDHFTNHASGISRYGLTTAGLRSAPIPWHDAHEQRRIADFLDDRVARIDQIITARHRQGRLATDHLASQLEALVDDYRRCAPSRRLGSMSFISSGKFLPSQDFEDDGAVRVFGGNGVAGGYRVANTKKHSLVVGRVGALCGNVHLLTEDAWVTDNALVVRLRDPEVSPAYVAAVLDAANLNSIASQTAQPLLTGTQIGDWSIPITSSSQQEQLVEVWRRKSSTAATDLFRRSIRLMSEYKQSLITAAVTGELDVTTATTTLP